jgi:hypothetical protein
MAIGIGEVDLFSLEPLVQKTEKQSHFANQIMMTFFWRHFCAIGHFFSADMLLLFGAKDYKTGN